MLAEPDWISMHYEQPRYENPPQYSLQGISEGHQIQKLHQYTEPGPARILNCSFYWIENESTDSKVYDMNWAVSLPQMTTCLPLDPKSVSEEEDFGITNVMEHSEKAY